MSDDLARVLEQALGCHHLTGPCHLSQSLAAAALASGVVVSADKVRALADEMDEYADGSAYNGREGLAFASFLAVLARKARSLLSEPATDAAPTGEAQNVHVCEECPDCIHNGNKCCGCYDGFCCRTTVSLPEGGEQRG